ncbi:DNA alkylation repair protein [Dellaglioa carnosa]|uniref:DNA alkylation repair protein n=1 Tax=Dellaglioa carnosa TaxID=2995136 RepID=A0ABT4JK98_9LACO|nr:DNA alkylation repair protein [Dellaglioa carnosa]MCZ2490715.1 DNA alkylation repair protein [Dellaglioa carnosa]MCZ2493793.1 DNA alkylation repair protein [Dellaglioa carnosa]MDK1730657.1 DNA alkylation repair protein [Dellaglioa carnosa]
MIDFEADNKNVEKMKAYMKNRFVFLGIRAPDRRKLIQGLMKESKTWSLEELTSQILAYYDRNEREYQYVAIDLAQKNVKRLTVNEAQVLIDLIPVKAWWDSVDSLRKVISDFVKLHPEYFSRISQQFEGHEDFWMRRVGINLQLGYREATNLAYLTKMIMNDQTTDEFFIQKAIGWSLREYAKTDMEWVKTFIKRHDLSKLAVREGLKHLAIK